MRISDWSSDVCSSDLGDAAQGGLRQQLLHDPHPGAEQKRERRGAEDALRACRGPDVPVPLPLAEELGRLLGQSLRPASGDVGLFPADALGLPGDGARRPAVLIAGMETGRHCPRAARTYLWVTERSPRSPPCSM